MKTIKRYLIHFLLSFTVFLLPIIILYIFAPHKLTAGIVQPIITITLISLLFASLVKDKRYNEQQRAD